MIDSKESSGIDRGLFILTNSSQDQICRELSLNESSGADLMNSLFLINNCDNTINNVFFNKKKGKNSVSKTALSNVSKTQTARSAYDIKLPTNIDYKIGGKYLIIRFNFNELPIKKINFHHSAGLDPFTHDHAIKVI